jgi:hypothetical protein
MTMVLPLVVATIWIGLYPAPVLRRLEPSVTRIVDRVRTADCNAPAVPVAPPDAPPGLLITPPCNDTEPPASIAPPKGDGRR